MTEEEGLYNPTSVLSRLNIKWSQCDAERAAFSKYGKHEAPYCMDFERFVRTIVRPSRQKKEEYRSALEKIDQAYGEGLDPMVRQRPDFISKEELQKRHLLTVNYIADSGLGEIEKKGGHSTPEIHLYYYRNWKSLLVPFLSKRIEKDMNSVFAFLGVPGSAKSMSAIQVLRALDCGFHVDRIALSQELFFNIEGNREETKGRAVMEDDMSRWNNARTYGSDDNIITAEMFDTFRFKNEYHGITTPRDSRIDKAVREHIQLVFTSPDNDSQGIFEVGIPEWGDDGKMKKITYLRFEEPGTFFSEGECDPFVWILDSIQFDNPLDFPDTDPVKQIVLEYLEKKKEMFWEADQQGRKLVEIGKMKKELDEQKIRDEYNALPEKRRIQEEREETKRIRVENEKRKAELDRIKLDKQEEKLKMQAAAEVKLRCTHCGNIQPYSGKAPRVNCQECGQKINTEKDRLPERHE